MPQKFVEQEEQLQKNIEQLRHLEKTAWRLEKIPQRTPEQQQWMNEYQKYRPAVQALLRLAGGTRETARAIHEVRTELETNKPGRFREAMAGAGAGAVGVFSLIGHPFVQAYESFKGTEIVTLKDTDEVLRQANRHLRGEQTAVWGKAMVTAVVYETTADRFFDAFNNMTNAILQGNTQQLSAAKYELGLALRDMQGGCEKLSKLVRENRNDLQQLNGFLEQSEAFVKKAAIEVTIAVATAGVVHIGFQAAAKALPRVAPAVAEGLTRLGERTARGLGMATRGAVEAERVLAVGGRVVTGTRVGVELADTAHDVKGAVDEMSECAERNARVKVLPIPPG